MRRLALWVIACGLFAVPFLSAQSGEAEKKGEQARQETSSEEGMDGWKWANFILLVGVLAYFGVKLGRPYFLGQAESINKGLTEARRRRDEADRRSAEVQRRLANLGADIEAFRNTALAEQAAHAEEVRRQAEREMERIRANAEQQIETVGKRARVDLQRHASRLALDLAEQRVRDEMNPEMQRSLTGQFVDSLKA